MVLNRSVGLTLSNPTALIDIAIVALLFFWCYGYPRHTRGAALRGIGVVLAISILLCRRCLYRTALAVVQCDH